MIDLSTSYLGLKLKNPLVASPSPISEHVDSVRRLEEAGVAAVVMHSLFEEQVIHESLELDHFLDYGTYSFSEALTYLPDTGRYSLSADRYIEHLNKVKQAVGIPVIGSLNGVSSGGWVKYAKKIEEAGADALELNIYYLPFDVNLASGDLEKNYIRLVSDVRAQVGIPLAVKVSPFFTGMAHVMKQLVAAGAQGLALFNRFYQPDFDLEKLDVVPNLVLSSSNELRMPLRWIALLYGQVDADFAVTTGVHSADDVLKAMMAGASVAMMASALLKNGPKHAAQVLADIRSWMEKNEYESIRQMKGSMSARTTREPHALRRSNYIKVLNSFKYLP
ncbi:MAG: dihydroorotate dehydrogenase-like protein [Chloroflexi bacterium]|nr:dihydroorotate dehydrogenase-like protein [Chloroflexota bacterium]